MVPVRRLKESCNSSRLAAKPISLGMVPVKLLIENASSLMVGSPMTNEGRVPVNELFRKSRTNILVARYVTFTRVVLVEFPVEL